MNQVSKQIADHVKRKGRSISEVAEKLGISSQRLGQYVNGRQKPKADFYIKWNEVFGENLLSDIETNVSRGGHKEPDSYRNVLDGADTPGPNDLTLQALVNVSESNRSLADSNKEIAQANKSIADSNVILARSNEELVSMLKSTQLQDADKLTLNETVGYVQAMRRLLVEIAAKVNKVSPDSIRKDLDSKDSRDSRAA